MKKIQNLVAKICLRDELVLCSLNCHTHAKTEIVLRASEYLLTSCEWFLQREEISLKPDFHETNFDQDSDQF